MYLSEDDLLIKGMKPHLRLNPGDLDYYMTDRLNKNPMVVRKLIDPSIDDSGDYVCEWFDSQKCLKRDFFFDHALKS